LPIAGERDWGAPILSRFCGGERANLHPSHPGLAPKIVGTAMEPPAKGILQGRVLKDNRQWGVKNLTNRTQKEKTKRTGRRVGHVVSSKGGAG